MAESPVEMLARHEGFRGRPYDCTSGKLSIGYGFNLDDWPLTEAECLPILESRMRRVRTDLANRISYFFALPEAAQDVLVNMGYQMGVSGVLGFKRFLAALQAGKFEDAYHEMMQSKWGQQTPNRARELADIIRTLP